LKAAGIADVTCTKSWRHTFATLHTTDSFHRSQAERALRLRPDSLALADRSCTKQVKT
jgi:hypothetical protein